MYTKCKQNVYIPHFIKLLYTCYIQNQKNYASYILYTNVSKNLSKCGIHFVYNFLYILYTKVCRNVGCILYTNTLYTNILYTFCIHQFWCSKSVPRKHYVYNLYTNFTQNAYTNNCMENGSLISTYFDPFVVHFLRLETCRLSAANMGRSTVSTSNLWTLTAHIYQVMIIVTVHGGCSKKSFYYYFQKQLYADVLQNSVVRNVAIFTGKHLFWSLFLITLMTWNLQLY